MKIRLQRGAMREVLRSDGVAGDVTRRARRIATAAGPGHEVDTRLGRNRARASVRTATHAAREAEALNRNLTASIDAGRR